MTIDEFEDIAMSEFEELPEPVKDNLNLGISIIPDAKMDEEKLTYILGEYYRDPMMGRGIRLFYGSFMVTMGYLPENLLANEIIKTVKHELRHHVEMSAGVDYLGKEDRVKMAKIKKRFGLLPDDQTIMKSFFSRFVGAVMVLTVIILLLYFLFLRRLT